MECPICKKPHMLRVSMYDPEGTIPLKTTKDKDGEEWVCLNCEASYAIPC